MRKINYYLRIALSAKDGFTEEEIGKKLYVSRSLMNMLAH